MVTLRHGSDDSVSSAGRKEAGAKGIERISTSNLPPHLPNAPLILDEGNAVEHTAYVFSKKKKWWILTVVALCQTSMSKRP